MAAERLQPLPGQIAAILELSCLHVLVSRTHGSKELDPWDFCSAGLEPTYPCKRCHTFIYIYIGGLGELVRFIRPPVTGRSASFRLRFRFVRAVRAVRGEAKLCGHMF